MALLMAVARSGPRPKPNVACCLHARCAAPAGTALESRTAASRAKPPNPVGELIIVHTSGPHGPMPWGDCPTVAAGAQLTSKLTAKKLPARQLVTATRVKEDILLPPHQGLATHPILAQHLRHA